MAGIWGAWHNPWKASGRPLGAPERPLEAGRLLEALVSGRWSGGLWEARRPFFVFLLGFKCVMGNLEVLKFARRGGPGPPIPPRIYP